jgi:multimeric flavodoxin WrbA
MSEIKVLGISGSPRKGRNTEKLLKEALNATEEVGAKTEALSLGGLNIQQCSGCNTCVKEKRCPKDEKDDMSIVKEKLESADAIIFAAPSYFGGVPGIMKNLMDRSRSLKMNNHRLRNKVASMISLAGLRYGGAEQVTEALVRFSLMHGMIVVGAIDNPISGGYFGIASLQSDEGWRQAQTDKVAVENSRSVGKRVVEVCHMIKASK